MQEKRFLARIGLEGRWGRIVYLSTSLVVIIGLLIGIVKLYGVAKASAAERNDAFRLFLDASERLEQKNLGLYESRLKGAFTEEQLSALTGQFVSYDLYINNRKVEDDQTIVYSQTPYIRITFYEKFDQNIRELFPESILIQTSEIAGDSLADRILVSVTESDYLIEERVTEDGIRKDLIFNGVEPGEIVTLDMDYEFSELIGLSNSSIEIFYNVTTEGN